MKKKETETKASETVRSVEEMILDYPVGKYSAIPLAAFWAKELRRREEHRHLTSNEILDISLRDVLGGEVDWKDLKKAAAASAAGALNGDSAGEGKKSKG